MILVKGLQRYQRSKLEFEKNICQRGQLRVLGFEPGWSADIFFDLQLWPLISLQPLDQNQCLVLHLKDLLHICLEAKAQGFWVTFKVFNFGSKWPHIYRAYVLKGVYFIIKTLYFRSKLSVWNYGKYWMWKEKIFQEQKNYIILSASLTSWPLNNLGVRDYK